VRTSLGRGREPRAHGMTCRVQRWCALATTCARWLSRKRQGRAQRRMGYAVYGYGVGDLVKVVNQVTDAEIDQLVAAYYDEYEAAPELLPGGRGCGAA